MAKASATVSIADIERQIEERRSQVQTLFAKRDQLQKAVDDLDAQIQGIANVDGLSRRRRRGTARPKNATPLRPIVLSVLGKNKKGLSLADLSDKVLETGYKSNASKFSNVVYQCLYNTPEIVHDDATGRYQLKK